jgi:hypothetical protein
MLVTGTARRGHGQVPKAPPPAWAADPGSRPGAQFASAGFNRSCGERRNRSPDGIVVIQMSWWEIILFIAVVIFAIYAFASIVGFRTRTLTRPTDRTAENMYDNYADPPRQQRRYARHHGGEGHDGE